MTDRIYGYTFEDAWSSDLQTNEHKLVIVGVKVAKRTKKRIKLVDRHPALGFTDTVNTAAPKGAFDTPEEARAHAIERAKRMIQQAEFQLEAARACLRAAERHDAKPYALIDKTPEPFKL